MFNFEFGDNVNDFIMNRELDPTTNKSIESGELSVQGTSLINAGDTVTLNGFGSKFSGDFSSKFVFHTVEYGSWKTSVLV